MTLRISTAVLAAALACSGCDDDDDQAAGPTPGDAPSSYSFSDAAGSDSVSYTGQVFRHVLINDMQAHIGSLTARLDGGSFFPASGDVGAELDFYFNFDADISGAVAHRVSSDPQPTQTTYEDFGSAKNLSGKIAGNDEVGQHADWNTSFVGWSDADVTSPESLVLHWFARLDSQAMDWANGVFPTDPAGAAVSAVYKTSDGTDLQQLLQKFLLGAIAFSQGTDDYLDDDTDGKGLKADNVEIEAGKNYTALAHGWDEAFGYYGAARNNGDFSDVEIADNPAHDSDGDGSIDLLTEYNWGHSLNSAKRDKGAAAAAATDFSAGAFEAFIAGRHLIATTEGALSDEQASDLAVHRDAAIANWESAIAATVAHYINEVLGDMTTFGTSDYSFDSHSKHWSEMKGFALSFQFNPRSPLSNEQFTELHSLLGQSPSLPGDDADLDYPANLRAARALIGNAYDFDDANLGDDDGAGGW